jgi:hypothetical protein
MRFMAEELKKNGAPARVMEWARSGGRQRASVAVKEGRNAPALV